MPTVVFKINKPGGSFSIKGESFDNEGNRHISPAGQSSRKTATGGTETVPNYWVWPAGINEMEADTDTPYGRQLYNFLINQKGRLVSGPEDTRITGFYVVDVEAERQKDIALIMRIASVQERLQKLIGLVQDAEANEEGLVSIGRKLNIQEAFEQQPNPIILWGRLNRAANSRDLTFLENQMAELESESEQSLYNAGINAGALLLQGNRVLLRASAEEEPTDIGLVMTVTKQLAAGARTEAAKALQQTVRAAIQNFLK